MKRPADRYDELHLRGYWWLPGEEGASVPGLLEYGPETGAVLETMGELVPWGVLSSAEAPAVIYGRTLKGEAVTLLQNTVSSSTENHPGYTVQRVRSYLLVVGAHYASLDAFTARRVDLRLSHLAPWVNRYGFSLDRPGEDGVLRVEYRFPQETSVDVAGRFRLQVTYGQRSGGPRHTYTIEQDVLLRLEEDGEVPFEVWRRRSLLLRDFLTLLVGRSVEVERLTARSEAARRELNGRPHYEPIHVYERPFHPSRKPVKEARDVPFPLAHVEGRLGDMLGRWFERAEVLEPALDLYFGTVHEPSVRARGHLLDLALAAEAYHRRTSRETVMPEEEHAEVVQALLDAVPQARRAWLAPRLQYTNELGLRSRLKRLYDSHAEVYRGYIDRRSFTHGVWQARNGIVHSDPGTEGTPFDRRITLILQLRTVLEACFLSEMGIEDDEIRERLAPRLQARKQGLFV